MKFLVKVIYPDAWKGEKSTSWISDVNVGFINKGVADVKFTTAHGIPADAILEIGSMGVERYDEIKQAIVDAIRKNAESGNEDPIVLLLPLREASDDDDEEEPDNRAEDTSATNENDSQNNGGDDKEDEDARAELEAFLEKLRARKAELEQRRKEIMGEDDKGGESKEGESTDANSEKTESAKENEEPQETDPFKEVKEQLDGLVNVDEFRALCGEIMHLAPQMVKRKAQSIFTKQVYLFSIGEGQGLSTCLQILGDTVVAAGLVRESKSRVLECTLPYDEGEKNSTWEEDAMGALSKAANSAPRTVLCYDISAWIAHLTNVKFRDFLRSAFERLEYVTLVFRVPYLDKEVLSRVQEGLGDVFFTRSIVFPPLTMADFRTLTEHSLGNYGYKLSKNAWPFIEQKLSEEKSDGRFYGVDTLQKVIGELLYKKELSNLRAKKDSLTITKADARAICTFPEEVNADDMLGALVGMEEIKQRLKEVVAQIEAARSIPGIEKPCIHMRFLGNPGTGKTSIARILGKLLKEKGILRIGNFYEYAGRDFCGKYIGETAPKTSGICRDAYGSVLFIDEAYSLYRGDKDSRDYGREALDTLIAEMENHRDDMLVIMAGYPDEMETMMNGNVGLQSRMPYTIDFRNYGKEQLFNIFMGMLKKSFEYEPDVETAAKEYFDNLDDAFLASKEFSNGRFVRNLFERTWAKASMRTELNKGKIVITKEDFVRSTADVEFKKSVQGKRRIGFGFNS